jgi:hypothetical protein
LARVQHRTTSAPARRLALAALAALGCATSAGPHGTTVLAKVPERIVILPLNVTTPMPGALEKDSPAVWSALELYLRAHGASLKTVSFPTARTLWLASIRDARNDPKIKKPGFDDAARLLVAKLRPETEFDALIIPSLYVQRASVAGGKVAWDGSQHALEMETAHGLVEVPEDAPIEGAVPAASLHAVVFNAEGSKIHEGRAGIALLVRGHLVPSAPNDPPNVTLVARRDPFDDRDLLMTGTARAFVPFIPLLSDGELGALGKRVMAPPPAAEPPAPESESPPPR